MAEAVELLTSSKYSSTIESGVIVGGVALFEETLFHPLCDSYHVTRIQDRDFPCDTFLTAKTWTRLHELPPVSMSEEISEKGLTYRMFVYNPSISAN